MTHHAEVYMTKQVHCCFKTISQWMKKKKREGREGGEKPGGGGGGALP